MRAVTIDSILTLNCRRVNIELRMRIFFKQLCDSSDCSQHIMHIAIHIFANYMIREFTCVYMHFLKNERNEWTMKISKTIGVIIAAATILLAVSSAVTYFLYRFSKDKAYNEKWEDYIDCGRA